MISRQLFSILAERVKKGKDLVLTGPRQVGKTTLLKALQTSFTEKTLWLNCDEPDVRKYLTDVTSTQLNTLIGNADIILIDEAQRVKNIGLTLKLLVDNFPDKKVIVTGSSALELSNEVNEPLTGRKFEYNLLPISVGEMVNHTNVLEEKRLMEHRLIYGMYPEVILNVGDEAITSDLRTS